MDTEFDIQFDKKGLAFALQAESFKKEKELFRSEVDKIENRIKEHCHKWNRSFHTFLSQGDDVEFNGSDVRVRDPENNKYYHFHEYSHWEKTDWFAGTEDYASEKETEYTLTFETPNGKMVLYSREDFDKPLKSPRARIATMSDEEADQVFDPITGEHSAPLTVTQENINDTVIKSLMDCEVPEAVVESVENANSTADVLDTFRGDGPFAQLLGLSQDTFSSRAAATRDLKKMRLLFKKNLYKELKSRNFSDYTISNIFAEDLSFLERKHNLNG